MKKLFSLLTLALLTMSAWATTYTHTFASGDLKTDAGDVTLSGLTWTQTAASAINFNGGATGKGIQIGTGSNPTTSFSLSTSAITGTITKIIVNSSIASGGDATMTVSVGGQQWGETTTLTTTATDYTFEGSATGAVAISFAATVKAFYIKSITIEYEGAPLSVAAPVFSPNGGVFKESQTVTITCDTEGATIMYALNDGEFQQYNNAITLTETTTIKAKGVYGEIESEEVSATFRKVEDAPANTFMPYEYTAVENQEFTVEKDGVTLYCSNGTITSEQFRFYKSQTVSFTTGADIADIVKIEFTCTANGTTKEGPGCLALNEGQNGLYTYETDGNMGTWTGKAASVSFNTNANQVRATKIVFTLDDGTTITVAAPTLPEECEFEESKTIEITNNEEGATVMYALNDGQYQTYENPFTIEQTTTVKAYAELNGTQSNVVTATYTLKEQPVGEGPIFTLVTDINDLAAGDKIILVNTKENGDAVAMAGFRGTNFGGVNVVVANNKVQTNEANVITLEANGTNWNLKTADGYLYASGTGNHMKLESTVDEDGNANAAITMANDTTKIIFQGTSAQKNVRYNPNSGNPIFSCYKDDSSIKNPVYIYKTTEEIVEVKAPTFNPAPNTNFNGSLQITLACENEGATIYYGFDNENWVEYNAPFTINETCTVYAYAKVGNAQSTTASAKYYKLAEVTTLAEANALDKNTNFVFNGNVIVVYQNGGNLWVKDNTAVGLIYGNQVPTVAEGATLKEEWTAQYTLFREHINEYQYPSGVEVDTDIPVQTIEATEYTTLTEDNINERVIIKGQTLTAGEDPKYLYTTDGMAIYNQFNITYPTDLEKTYDVEGMVSYYNNAVQIMPIAITEAASEVLLGDVDDDGKITISDVTVLIDYLLGSNPQPFNAVNADVDTNGNISISDVTALIDILLSM